MATELREEEERPNPAGEITQQGPLAKGGGKKKPTYLLKSAGTHCCFYGVWSVGTVGMGWGLDWMIFVVFCSVNDLVTLSASCSQSNVWISENVAGFLSMTPDQSVWRFATHSSLRHFSALQNHCVQMKNHTVPLSGLPIDQIPIAWGGLRHAAAPEATRIAASSTSSP